MLSQIIEQSIQRPRVRHPDPGPPLSRPPLSLIVVPAFSSCSPRLTYPIPQGTFSALGEIPLRPRPAHTSLRTHSHPGQGHQDPTPVLVTPTLSHELDEVTRSHHLLCHAHTLLRARPKATAQNWPSINGEVSGDECPRVSRRSCQMSLPLS